MAKIIADGDTFYGRMHIEISGAEAVEDIACDDDAFKVYTQKSIDDADGWMANAYHPPAGTMLQAFAFLTNIFGYDNVTVDGNIGEIPIDSDAPPDAIF